MSKKAAPHGASKPQALTNANYRPNAFDPTKVAGKGDYIPLPVKPPPWASLGRSGEETYSRIRKEQTGWHRGTGTRAFVGKPDMENLIVVCRLADQIEVAQELVDQQRETGELAPSAITALNTVVKSYQRAIVALGYDYGNTNYIDPNQADEDADDFG